MSGPTFTSPNAPRGALFNDSGAAAVYAALDHLTETGRQELLDRLTAEQLIPDLRSDAKQAQVGRALAALREAHALLQETAGPDADDSDPDDSGTESEPRRLSIPVYDSLYAEHGRRLGWPPGGTIRRWMGGTWNDCLAAAGLELVVDGDVLVRELGGPLTREEVLQAVRDCAAETKVQFPTLTAVLRWARRPDVRARPGRRPMSQGPFDRLFGSWAEVLVNAGLIDEASAGLLETPAQTSGGGRKVFLRSAYGYRMEQLLDALREIAERMGRSPKTTEYKHERDRLLVEEADGGLPPRPFPSLTIIQKRFATWDDGLIAAGLEPVNGRHNKVGCGIRRTGRAVSEPMIIDALREAYTEIGDPFTQPAYSAWRKVQQQRDREARRFRQLPSYDAIWTHCGTWAKACDLALYGWTPERDEHATADDEPGPEAS